jgi:hypothetical protein
MRQKDDQKHAIIRNLMVDEATHGPLAAEATNASNMQTVGCLNEILD